ncbi:LPS translocon maturation chaperone LptM [Herbaspirillum rhizosphaerae]|uniref:LPS translocon maturation chaperone LptM n=1 Tax=Herbaspirillum rhizosphaerae TaxID=346179 RepID=UPI0038BB68A4
MKSPFYFSPARPASLSLSAVALIVLLTGCGQKGPLYLPKPPAPHPVRTAPAPAAADVGADAATDPATDSATDAATDVSTGKAGAASSNTAVPQSK